MLPSLEFHSRRSPILGRSGMIAASQPLAVAAGLQILDQGGSAADASVAVAAALNVTEPGSTGLGGDCFALYYEAATGQVAALNGSGRAPAALSLERLRKEGLEAGLPPHHPFTITVPGACAGWCDLVARFGRLPFNASLAPAIRLAEEGFPVAPLTAYHWQVGAENQLRTAPGGRELTVSGRAPRAGEIFRNPGLARTLRSVAEGGQAAFYQGELAKAVVQAVQGAGGCLTLEDMAAHTSTWETPIHTTYRGLRVWECPPNGQGLVTLLALNLLEGYDLSSLDPLSPERLHLVIEALRLAFTDARRYVADPAFQPAPLEALLSKAYAAGRRGLIRPGYAALRQAPGGFATGTDTVYFSVVDGAGNACSFINSNYMGFGTGIVPDGLGFCLQNRGHNFSLDPAHPNALAPAKRPYHTIIPSLITRPAGTPPEKGFLLEGRGEALHPDSGESLYACYGVMGGFMQPQGQVQVVVGLVDDGLDPQAALDRPRVYLADGRPDGKVDLELGIPAGTAAALREWGHPVAEVGGLDRAVFGRGQVILRDPQSGVLWGGSDPRADGCAMAAFDPA